MSHRPTGLNHQAGSLLPKLRGVLPTLARHTDILPAGPAVPPVRCPPSGVNPTLCWLLAHLFRESSPPKQTDVVPEPRLDISGIVKAAVEQLLNSRLRFRARKRSDKCVPFGARSRRRRQAVDFTRRSSPRSRVRRTTRSSWHANRRRSRVRSQEASDSRIHIAQLDRRPCRPRRVELPTHVRVRSAADVPLALRPSPSPRPPPTATESPSLYSHGAAAQACREAPASRSARAEISSTPRASPESCSASGRIRRQRCQRRRL